MTEEPIGDELLAALEVAVLEEDSAGTLRPIGTVPEWFRRFRPAAVSAPESLGKALGSPFLENFLIDAKDFWKYRGPGRLRSGLWTETGDMGTDFQLEASAVCVGGRRILLLAIQTLVHEEKQAVLQRARSNNLRRRERKRAEKSGAR
ncbi:MAG TPA: hypothetical protein VLU06_07990 [Thermoanaerobaculia bacterium]|nr:hypothetical protein [Thermoanaerobaculia bacterium]